MILSTVAATRKNLLEKHKDWYTQAMKLANTVETEPTSTPRICPKQTLRENYKTETAEDYYRVAVSAQVLDHMESQLSMPFDKKNLSVIKGFVIIPELIRRQITSWKDDFLAFAGQYKNDLPSERILKAEMDMWETYWQKKHAGVIPDRVSTTLKMMDICCSFPSIVICLKLIGTMRTICIVIKKTKN